MLKAGKSSVGWMCVLEVFKVWLVDVYVADFEELVVL